MAPHAPRTPSHQPSQEQPFPGLITLARGEQPEIDLEIKKSHFLARACRTDPPSVPTTTASPPVRPASPCSTC